MGWVIGFIVRVFARLFDCSFGMLARRFVVVSIGGLAGMSVCLSVGWLVGFLCVCLFICLVI